VHGSGAHSIQNYSQGVLTISGGTVSNTSSRAIFNSGKVTVSGNALITAPSQTIYNRGTLTISGGAVTATGMAVYNYSAGGTIIILGGTVTGTKYNNNNNATIIEWTETAPKTYTAFTNTNLTITPTTATARWLNKDGIAGIDYTNTNGTVTGFVPVSGVTVSKVATAKPSQT